MAEIGKSGAGSPARWGIILPALLLLLIPPVGSTLSIVQVGAGNWSTTLNASDLSGGPGTDFSTQNSASNQVILDTEGTAATYYVDVSKTEVAGQTWSSNLQLYVIRTGNDDGTGNGVIGSTPPIGTEIGPLSTSGQNLYSGTKKLFGVPVQLRVYATAAAGQGTYATTVYYTIHN